MRFLLLVALGALLWAPTSLGAVKASPTTIAPSKREASALLTIYVRNVSTTVTDQEILNDLSAFQAAVSQDFAPYWADAQLVFIGRGTVPSRGETITVEDTSPDWNALGWHEVWRKVPRARVFARTSSEDSIAWSTVFTHELFEMLGDPYTTLMAQVGQRFYIEENCDPVEENNYTRPAVDGTDVAISDFVLPSWFVPKSYGPYDFMGLLTRPLQILPGGYISYWQDGIWEQVNG